MLSLFKTREFLCDYFACAFCCVMQVVFMCILMSDHEINAMEVGVVCRRRLVMWVVRSWP